MEKGYPTDAATNPVLSAVVQLLTANDQVAGTGFAVYPRGLIVTCAHVANVALGRDAKASEVPSTTVRVMFAGSRHEGQGEIIAWSPYAQHDVAVLRVPEGLLEDVLPLELSDLPDLGRRTFRVYGFPQRAGYEAGRFARGEVGERRLDGRLQAQSQELRPGDSGSFVQELQMGRVIGMVSAVDTGEAGAALIPARTIVQVCPEVKLKQVLYPFAPLTDGLATLPGNVLANLEDFLDEYLGNHERPVPFGGRGQALARLDAWLADATVTYGVLAETAGKGKSALLTQWVTRVIADRRADVVFVPISQRFDTALYSRFCALLGARLRQLCTPGAESILPNSAEQWWPEIDYYLREDQPVQQPLLIVLDGLDEAADWEAGRDLRLPKRLGTGIKVLVSARLIGEDEDASGWLTRLHWRSHAQAVPLESLTQEGVAEVLTAMGNPLDKLAPEVNVVAELYKLSEGDPLLVRLYVEALLDQDDRLAFLTPEALRKLQPGMAGYFDAWFEAQNRSWRAQGQEPLYKQETVITFLNLLACALGPLSREDVAAIAGPPFNQWHQVELVTQTVMRFVLGNGTIRGYTFSHPRLAQYFQDRMLKEERSEWQRRYLGYGLQTMHALSAKSISPDEASRYMVQHYGAHLAQADDTADERFYELVNQQWMQAWFAVEGESSGFLNDVDRAWQRAVLAERWGQQVRCVLCHSSVVALSSNVPALLLRTCLEASVLQLSQALQLALNHPHPLQRISNLISIVSWLDDSRRHKALQVALSAALALPMEGSYGERSPRAEALIALAPHLTTELLQSALDAALPVEGRYGSSPRAELLTTLAPHLTTELLPTALDAALALPMEGSYGARSPRAEALAALAPHLTEPQRTTALQAALDAALALPVEDSEGNSPRVAVLMTLAPHLTEPQRTTALQATLDAVLALPMAGSHGRHSLRIEALTALAPHLTEPQRTTALDAALDAALSLPVEGIYGERSPRAKALTTLAPHLTEPQRTTALDAALDAALSLPVEDSRGSSPRAEVLTTLAPHLTEPQRTTALQAALDAALALPMAGSYGERSPRAEALAALAPHLTEPQRTTALQAALDAALSLPVEDSRGSSPRAEALAALAPHLTEPQRTTALQAALDAALALPMAGSYGERSPRTAALTTLAPHLTIELLPTALDAALALPVEGRYGERSPRAEALIALAPHLTTELLPKALDAALALPVAGSYGRSPRGEALAALAPHLTTELLQTALDAALALPVELSYGARSPRVMALMALAPHLTTELLPTALDAALALPIKDRDFVRSPRVEVLTALAPHLTTELLPKALDAALALPVEDSNGRHSPRVEALMALAPYMTEQQHTTALQAALDAALSLPVEDSEGSSPRIDALAALAPHLAEPQRRMALPKALDAVLALPVERSHGERSRRVTALIALAPHCVDRDFAHFKKVLAKAIWDYSRVRRPKMLIDLEVLVENLPIFHKPDVADEVFNAVQDVTNWWP